MTKKTDNPEDKNVGLSTEPTAREEWLKPTPKTDDTIDEIIDTLCEALDPEYLKITDGHIDRAKVDINNYFGGLEIKTRLNELEQVVIYGESENYVLNRIKELKEAL